MLWSFRLLWALAGLLLVPAAGAQTPLRPPPGAETVVTGVWLTETAGATRLVLQLSRRIEHRVFFLNEPMRAVVDLPAVQWKIAGGEATPGGLVAGLRYGAFDAQTGRIVLDLAQPAKLREARYDLPSGTRPGQRLILDFERTSDETFAKGVQPWSVSGVLRALQAAEPPPPQPARMASAAGMPPPLPAPAPQPQLAFAAPPRPVPPTVQAVAPPPSIANPRMPPNARQAVRPTVVLDAGHGGVDPGTIGVTGTHEKDITLAMVREVRRQLEQGGRYRVQLTRDDDVFIRLRDRIAIARQHSADLFISIHADSMGSGPSSTRGASVYTLSENASDAEAAGLAARENRADIIAGVDLTRENRDVTSILIDLAQRETMNHSIVFARQLVTDMGREALLLPQSPHRFAGFAVLRAPDVPSVLIELGYLSNREDEQLLNRPVHRTKMAGGIVRAIDAYFAANPVRGR
ncbi:MAG: N-acetylmuramoyl-L-alanine amidase [Proteobacteria bacterium]|nr:N-acetylmuramoyl-L-alanine amidase [Pseudomonadota bacterium]